MTKKTYTVNEILEAVKSYGYVASILENGYDDVVFTYKNTQMKVRQTYKGNFVIFSVERLDHNLVSYAAEEEAKAVLNSVRNMNVLNEKAFNLIAEAEYKALCIRKASIESRTNGDEATIAKVCQLGGTAGDVYNGTLYFKAKHGPFSLEVKYYVNTKVIDYIELKFGYNRIDSGKSAIGAYENAVSHWKI